jgi:glyoxylase-like metal-dependent hydrolase (beta-lactamase superfamily II)
VLHVPGHTAGSLALFLPATGELFTGDTVAGAAGQPILGPFNVDRPAALESFRRLAQLDSTMALFGHGEPILSQAAPALRRAAFAE